MNYQEIKRKLTSRKLWAAIASFVAMLLTSRGASADEATQVTALIMAGATVISYIIGEGLIDAKREGQNDSKAP